MEQKWHIICYKDNTYGYVAFVSTIPFHEIDQSKAPPLIGSPLANPNAFKEFREAYAPIVMSVEVTHNSTSPTSTHFGIFRNPLDIHRSFLTGSHNHGNIASLLHGFAAAVEARFLGKTYMNTYPTKLMGDIIAKAVGVQNIENIDVLNNHPDCRGKKWDFSMFTDDGKPIAIKLPHLISLFNDRKTKDVCYVAGKITPKSVPAASATNTQRNKPKATSLVVRQPRLSAIKPIATTSKQRSTAGTIQPKGPIKRQTTSIRLTKRTPPLVTRQPRIPVRRPAAPVRLKKPNTPILSIRKTKVSIRKPVATAHKQRLIVRRITIQPNLVKPRIALPVARRLIPTRKTSRRNS